jgi:hypothetical protein
MKMGDYRGDRWKDFALSGYKSGKRGEMPL